MRDGVPYPRSILLLDRFFQNLKIIMYMITIVLLFLIGFYYLQVFLIY